MKHNIKHISIPQPCTQNWADMRVADQGRFCQSCQKTVVDFTKLNNEEIVKVLSSSGKICGRFTDGQLETINIALPRPKYRLLFSWKKFSIAAAFIGFVSLVKAEAKIKPLVEHRPFIKKSVVDAEDTVKEFRTITGTVTNSLGQSLIGAMIRIKSLHLEIITDPYGRFSIQVPVSTDLSGRVVSIGFQALEFKIDPQINNYPIVLKEMNNMMGEVVILPVKKPVPSGKDQGNKKL